MGRFHQHTAQHTAQHQGPSHLGSGSERDQRADHGGYPDGTERVAVLERILGENDRIATGNRESLTRHGVRALNLMSSPGAGKTTLLARTIPELAKHLRVGVVEGDIATSLDADQLSGLGAQIALVNTSAGFGGECHLDAVMVRAGLDRLNLDQLDLVIIENVGNLVCPAEFDVGEDARAMVYAITEGEEKPLKYPVMFRAVDVVLVNKIDLLPYLDFDMAAFRANLAQVNPTAAVIDVSAKHGDGLNDWLDWLDTIGAR
jgi:hydrogenase nickel incorporation protein HypB